MRLALFALAVVLAQVAPTAARHHHRHLAYVDRGSVVGSRPSGCPSKFCGCEASLYLYGKIVPALNLAANWLRFPRALPGYHMAAARRGHVFVLLHQVAGDMWMVHDGNSGGHLTRNHVRSIRGYTIVNPN